MAGGAVAGRVLIGFAEALPAPEVVFSLRAAGHEVRTFARRGAAAMLGGLPVGDPIPVTPPEEDAAAAIGDLRAALDRAAPRVVLALDDVALWLCDAAFPDGPPPGVVFAHATGAQAAAALDKRVQLAAARAAGLAVPPTLVLDDPSGLAAVGAFPAILKPAMAVQLRAGRLAKGGARYLMSEADRAAAAGEAGILYPALVQPLVRGVGEGVFGVATAEGVTAWSGHRRLRMMNPHGSGASACAANPPGPGTRAAVAAMMDALGWRGPFMVECLRGEDGTLWFMELNGRMWGSMALARRNGLEYPAWAVAGALDPGFRPVPPEAPPGVQPQAEVRHLGRDLLHLVHVARGPRSAFHRAGWPRLWPALAAVLRPGRRAGFYNHDPAHPWFFLGDAWRTVRAAFGRGRGA
jgi:hypothetical protein